MTTWLVAPPGTRIGEPGWRKPWRGLTLTWDINGERPPLAVQRNGVLMSTGLPTPEPPPHCRVYWGSHGCRHPRGHSPEIPHECDCCECENHPDPDPDNPGSKPSCVAKPPYYGERTRFYGEDAEALGLPMVS